jgi:hypothetical protein
MSAVCQEMLPDPDSDKRLRVLATLRAIIDNLGSKEQMLLGACAEWRQAGLTLS